MSQLRIDLKGLVKAFDRGLVISLLILFDPWLTKASADCATLTWAGVTVAYAVLITPIGTNRSEATRDRHF
ncbi:MAG: hypothetical protein BRC50_07955 [Cyanobacteria bacterium SW_11_48_12]|nr:MAG: hypothetical protein BRC50_07955 [Cyanobacteria bacterium SW_11_48_12]